MNFRINLMWFLAMIVVVGISNAAFYDFEGGGGFTLNGNAVVDSGSVRLTENLGSQIGSVIFDQLSNGPIDSFEASFDFWIGPAGADGMAFAVMDAGVHDSTATWQEKGPGAGSLAVSFDTYTGNDVEINLDGTILTAAVPTVILESSQWIHAEISFAGGQITVVLTPENGIAETVIDAFAVPGFTPFVARYGISARTGGSMSEHRVDNVRIGARDKAYNPSPADGEFIRYSTDVTELRWRLPESLYDSNEPATVTCDVLWFDGDPNLPATTSELLVEGAAVESVLLEGRADVPAHYWWRVDCYDPNGAFVTKTEGDLWTFSSARDVAMVFLDESDGSTRLSEQDAIANRDDYLLSLSMDPGVAVSITVVELPNMFNPLTNTREELESYNGESVNAPLLWVTHSGGSVVLSRISSGADDLEEYLDDGEEQGTGSSDLEFFLDEGTSRAQMIALRFNTIAIPQGATIDSAIVEFEVDGTQASGEVYGIITGEAVDNAPPLEDIKFHLRDRLAANPTIATASFVWTADYAVDDKVPTSDFASVIQEIVDRPGWVLGNSLVLFFTEDMGPDPDDIDFIDATDPWALRSSTYVLDSSNWEGVTVTLAAIDDEDLETDPDLITLTARTSSTDPDWVRLPVADVIVSIGENECGAWSFVAYDFDGNCYVDMGDLAKILDEWLTCTTPNVSGCVETYRP